MTSGLRSGLATQWCAADEETYGVVPSLTGAPFYIWDSDSLALAKTTKQSTGIYAGAQYPTASRRVVTQYSATGATTGDLAQRGLNPWLYRMLGSYGQAAAALTEDATTGAYKAVHAPGALDGHSFSLQAGAPTVDTGTVEPFTYSGCKVADWTLTATEGDIVKLALTIQARNELSGTWTDPLNASVPALADYDEPPGGVFHWVGAQIIVGGTPSTSGGVTTVSSGVVAGNIKGPFSVKQTAALDLTRYAPDVAPFRNEPVEDGLRATTGQFVVEWLSTDTSYAAYQEDTATSIAYQFTGPAIGTGADVASLEVLVPNIRIDSAPVPRSGPAVLTETVSWTALRDGVNNPVQFTYYTLDSQ